MSDQGLSIFDNSSDDAADEATQVIPTVAKKPAEGTAPVAEGAPEKSSSRAATATQERPAVKAQAPAQRTDPSAGATAGQAAPLRSAPTHAPAATAPAAPQLPTVRRGGYDTAAVDSFVRTTSAEKAGLAASLTEAQSRLKALQAEVDSLRTTVEENQNPTYAGLGGKASELLRLAEEQSAEVIAEANAHAAQIRQQAQRDAASVKAEAEADTADLRASSARELEEHPGTHAGRHRGSPQPLDRRGRRPPGLRAPRGRAAPPGRRAGDQRPAHQRDP